MSAHTKGPWEWFMKGSDHFTLQAVDGDVLFPVADLSDYGLSLKAIIEVTPENARLIAAAPELLSIVQRFVALPSGAWHPERHAADEAELITEAKEAIAKASKP